MSDEAQAPFDDTEIAKDVLFDLLSSPRRRYILYYLHEHEPTITLNELGDQVAAWENEKPVDELTSQERKRVYVSLYQTHIPKLADSGIIHYDQDSGEIALTDHVDEFGPYLGWSERSVPWQLYYLVFASVSLVFYGLVVLDVGPLAAVPSFAAGLVIVAGLAALTIAHYVTARRQAVDMPEELIENR